MPQNTKIQKILSLFSWDSSPLIPAIAQDSDTKEILMLAFMDKEALNLTLQSGQMHYFSRSKNRIWRKGEQSGHIQIVQKVLIDCDNDALVFLIKQKGAACHTGQKSCFFREIDFISTNQAKPPKSNLSYGIIDDLYHTLLERKSADPSTSYTASLYAKGVDTIAKKIIEEASEVALALKDLQSANPKKDCQKNTKEAKKSKKKSTDKSLQSHLVYECADLLYHSLVALAKHNIHPEQVKSELARRFGIGGLAEKASRSAKSKKSSAQKIAKIKKTPKQNQAKISQNDSKKANKKSKIKGK